MLLILVVYYVTIAFLIDMNVIADPSSIPTKNGSSSIIVLNACSRDPPCLVSCIISFEDVKLYRSPILASAEKSYFPYANTTGLRVTIYKHIDVQDPGTVIITKKLKDGNHCFAVSGKYLTPEISNCLNASLASSNSTFCGTRTLHVRNNSSGELFIAVVKFNSEGVTTTHQLFPMDDIELDFPIKSALCARGAASSFAVYKQKSKQDTTMEVIQAEMTLGSKDTCVMLGGSFKTAKAEYTVCEQQLQPVQSRPETRPTRRPIIPIPLHDLSMPPEDEKPV